MNNKNLPPVTPARPAPSPERMRLLGSLEEFIAWSYYNSSKYNRSGSVTLDPGDWSRYPLTATYKGKPEKFKRGLRPGMFDPQDFMDAHYVFGTNKIFIMRALDEILGYLEAHHGLQLQQKHSSHSHSDA